MGEMDIYMRRRLVALGGLVAFFIIFVLLVKSCGGDDEPVATTTVGTTDEAAPTLLAKDEYIAQADAICAEANAAVGALDPTDEQATADEYDITANEQAELRQLEPEKANATLRDFLASLNGVVKALKAKATALDRGDTVTADEAQVEIDENEAEARSLGEEYGFSDCGQFLDAGQAPSGNATAPTTDTGVAPTTDETGGVVAPTPTEPAPTEPAPTEPAPTAPSDDSGGIAP